MMGSFVELGLLGLFLACFLSSTVVPFSSEAVLFALIAMQYPFWECILVASIGNTLGGLTTFWLGYMGKWEWVERKLRIKKERIAAFQHKSKKYGLWLALFTWLPIVGDIIALSFGFLRFHPWKVGILMFIGRFARYLAVALLTQWIF